MCDHGLCVSEPLPDDAAPLDGRVDARPVDAPTDAMLDAYLPLCGTTVLLTDNLDNTTAGPAFSAGADPGITVTEANGHLEITFASTVAAASYGFYFSTAMYPANGLCIAVEVSQLPSTSGTLTYFKMSSGTFEVEFSEASGMLEMRTRNPGLTTQKTIVMDPVAHRFWRIRQQGGTTYWDTAPDGINYVEQKAVTGIFTPTTASIELGAGAFAAVTNAGPARFEGVTARGP